MKLKGISKLVLAGTALAATAATLTTATYAWYVTNAKVNATGVQGSVAGAAAGSLFIAPNTRAENSTTDKPGVYVTKISLPNAEHTGYYQPASGLDAQSLAKEDTYVKADDVTNGNYAGKKANLVIKDGENYSAAGESYDGEANYYYKTAQGAWGDKDGLPIDGKLLTFKFWLKSSAAGNAAITLKVDNTTATANTQKALAGTGLPAINSTDVVQGQSFAVDAVHALRMKLDKTPYTTNASTNALEEKTASITHNTYQVDALADNYNTANTTAATTNGIAFATGGDAGTYYKAIMGYAPFNTTGFGTENGTGVSTDNGSGDAPSTTVNVSLGADEDTLLSFSVWLEGSDADCFDSCRGQSFKFDFEFNFTVSA